MSGKKRVRFQQPHRNAGGSPSRVSSKAGIGAGGDHRDGEKARALRFSSRDFSEHGISEISEVDKPAELRWSECARLSPRIWKGVADIFAVVAGKVVSRACKRGVLDWVTGKWRLLL